MAEDVIPREKIAQVFQYLRAFQQVRTPVSRVVTDAPWHLWLDDVPPTPFSWGDSIGEAPAEGEGSEDKEADVILRVRRPQLHECPSPPAPLDGWLEPGWRSPEKAIVTTLSRLVDVSGEEAIEKFEDLAERTSALKSWTSRRTAWAVTEVPLRQADRLFQRLYELHGRLQRESEKFELVLGDGLLVWKHTGGDIHFPVLLQPVQLEFDPSIPEFVIRERAQGSELNTTLIAEIAQIDGPSIAKCREEVAQGQIHPLLEQASNGFLGRLAVLMSARGTLHPGSDRPTPTEHPQFYRRPVLFLRPRAAGFGRALENILQDIDDGGELPASLQRVVGIDAAAPWQGVGEGTSAGGADTGEGGSDPLLSKLANPEQLEIVERLDKYGAVLVQGPPGTGKSHTIANLIGHLLAHNQTVLVTSHTTKALGVLRNHVVEQLRPLCVSVLESDSASQRQLEDSVTSISERLAGADIDTFAREVDLLEAERTRLKSAVAACRRELRDARADEHRSVVFGGSSWTPCDAAKFVRDGQDAHSWIPGPAANDEPVPLTTSEIREIYASNTVISADDEPDLAHPLPPLEALLLPARFASLVRPLGPVPLPDRHEWWTSRAEDCDPDLISEVGRTLVELATRVKAGAEWQFTATAAAIARGGAEAPWLGLADRIEDAAARHAESSELLIENEVWLPDEASQGETEATAQELLAHVQSKGSIGFLAKLGNKKWARFLREARVNGTEPSTAPHFSAIKSTATLRRLRAEVAKRWAVLMENRGAPSWRDLGPAPEVACGEYAGEIRRALNWHSNSVAPGIERLMALGFRWDQFAESLPAQTGQHAALHRLIRAISAAAPIMDGRIDAALRVGREKHLKALKEALSPTNCQPTALSSALARAVEAKDAASYRALHERINRLMALRGDWQRRVELITRLERPAPAWAEALRKRDGRHASAAPPGDPSIAWTWSQLHAELERRASRSIPRLQDDLRRLEDDLRTATVRLIDRRAWHGQLKRTTHPQRQALVGWLDLIRRIGRGTGVRVPALRAAAGKQMLSCRGAVPVWIMPLTRVAEMFDSGTRFDVVIIDEASQCDVMGLVALYLGKKVVVVGDHEQVSPSAVGQQLLRIQQLINQHLEGIPNRDLYDGKTSVYDLARQSFSGQVMLTEHFRCYPEIIDFSNWLSYNGRIKALRDPSASSLTPFVIPYRVPGGARADGGKVNPAEALHIASLIVACTRLQEYDSKSFGVVSLLGDHQAMEIDRLLRTHLTEAEYMRRRILCGNAAHFQGDERDVMFLSVVHSSDSGPLSLQEQPMFRQRLNVAASRACDQMWVVYSLDPDLDLKPGDLRRSLIEHALSPRARIEEATRQTAKADSEFERLVLKRLIAAGYSVKAQYPVGAYRIDLVVEGGGRRRLAVECDGERFHTLDNLDRDMARQAILERLGWQFVRIRGSEFFRDPDRALTPLFERLAALEITPQSPDPVPADTSELKTRVLALASQLRAEWRGALSSESDSTLTIAAGDGSAEEVLN